MNWTITKQWYEGNYEAGEPVYFFTEIYGLKAAMKGHETAVANFGLFEATGRRIVHCFFAGDKRYWSREEVFNSSGNDSHMLDDVNLFLIPGNVEFV